MERKHRRLYGMKAITRYLGRSAETVQEYRRKHGLPIVKIVGTWEADIHDLEDWRRDQAAKHEPPSSRE